MAIINSVNEVLHRTRVKLYPNYLPKAEGAYLAHVINEAFLSIEEVCAARKNRGGFTGSYDDLVEYMVVDIEGPADVAGYIDGGSGRKRGSGGRDAHAGRAVRHKRAHNKGGWGQAGRRRVSRIRSRCRAHIPIYDIKSGSASNLTRENFKTGLPARMGG